jgi:hypothetical protein
MMGLTFFPVRAAADAMDASVSAAIALARALFVVKFTYFNPVLGSDKELPPHQLLLGARGTPDVVGGVSDASGISGIGSDPRFSTMANARWTLTMVPYPAASPTDADAWKAEYLLKREFWIDLDKNEWVRPSTLGAIERRRLLRIPAWNSAKKAKSGGFSEVPTDAHHFADGGFFRDGGEMTQYGNKNAPWKIQLDYQWYRSYVAHEYYDWLQKKECVIPPGLIVEARDKHGTRVGAGTSLDLGGPVYILHERTTTASKDVHYAFAAPTNALIDLRKAAPAAGAATTTDDRIQLPATLSVDPKDRRSRYLLPPAWHSLGHEAQNGTAARQTYKALQSSPPDTTKAAPLFFHLDDTILVHGTTRKRVARDARVTLFDHFTRIRQPDTDHPLLWRKKLATPLIRAEEGIFTDGSGLEAFTLVICHVGAFHIVREQRVAGTPGTDPLIGARAANDDDVKVSFRSGCPALENEGTFELHLVPDAINGTDFYDGPTDVEMSHLFVYVPVTIAKAARVTDADVAKVEGALSKAAERWDQQHPAYPSGGTKKNYAIVPKAGVSAGTRIVKLRHFMAPIPGGRAALTIHATRGTDRAFVSGNEMTLFVDAATIETGDSGTDADGTSAAYFAQAHEFGHVFGLPDEYVEVLNGAHAGFAVDPSWDEPLVPRFHQAHDGYPFLSDANAMMRSNKLPRLRFGWHYVRFVNDSVGPTSLAAGAPYVLRYPTASSIGDISHFLPDVTGHADNHPWQIVAPPTRLSGSPATAYADLVLYRCGDDEGTVAQMFGSLAAAQRVNGILLVRTNYWFAFSPNGTLDFTDNPTRYSLMTKFYQSVHFASGATPLSFVLAGGSSLQLPRIAVMFQPRFTFGPRAADDTVFGAPRPTQAQADVVVHVVKAGATPVASNLASVSGARPDVQIGETDLGPCLARFALGVTPVLPGAAPGAASAVNNAAITVADMQSSGIAATIALMLGDPGGSARTFGPLP